MAVYTIFPNRKTVHGSFSKEYETILSINSGDTVQYLTFDAGWGSPSKEDQKTPNGWITFGFHEDLNEATVIALDGMLNLIGELYGLN